MSRRRLGAVLAVASASAFILIASTRISSTGDPHIVSDAFQEPLIRDNGEQMQQQQQQQRNFRVPVRTPTTWSASSDQDSNATNVVEMTLDEQRQLISEEMMGYNFPNGKYNVTASRLDDLVPEKGGEPIRSVVITTWRSGSTFLGDVLNSQPGNFYHYEPLLPLDIIQVGENSPFAESSVQSLRQMLQCNYTGMEDEYLSYGRDHNWLMSHNSRVWDSCGPTHELCWNPSFLSRSCRLFPFQSMKVVRLRLRLAARLLEDKSLNVRMILLVRDPRGTMQSRKHREWCPPSPDCSDPKRLCKDLVEDYWAAVELRKTFPDRFRVLRYEELSLNPSTATQSLFEFLGLAQGSISEVSEVDERMAGGLMESDDGGLGGDDAATVIQNKGTLHPAILHFLETHTKADQGGVSSTHRDSRSAPFRWRKELNPGEVANIQSSCKEALRLWGYREMAVAKRNPGKMRGPYKNTELEEFNPLGSLRLE